MAFFSGHFPKTPVLPGVVRVDWALALGQQRLDLPPRFAGMEVLKFQQLVRPGDAIELTLRFDRERQKLHLAYRNDTAARPAAASRWRRPVDNASRRAPGATRSPTRLSYA